MKYPKWPQYAAIPSPFVGALIGWLTYGCPFRPSVGLFIWIGVTAAGALYGFYRFVRWKIYEPQKPFDGHKGFEQ